MLIALALDVVDEYFAVARYLFGVEGEQVALRRFVVDVHGVFQYVDIGVGLQYAHVVIVGARCHYVVAIDECDVFALRDSYSCVAGR